MADFVQEAVDAMEKHTGTVQGPAEPIPGGWCPRHLYAGA